MTREELKKQLKIITETSFNLGANHIVFDMPEADILEADLMKKYRDDAIHTILEGFDRSGPTRRRLFAVIRS